MVKVELVDGPRGHPLLSSSPCMKLGTFLEREDEARKKWFERVGNF